MLETQAKPIGAKDDGAGEAGKENEKYHTTAYAHAAIAKAKLGLEPIIELVEQKELEQTGKTTGPVIELCPAEVWAIQMRTS